MVNQPLVTGVSPSSGSVVGGTTVTISGTNLADGFITLDDPMGVNGTYITGISGSTVVGQYQDANSVYHGFVYNGSSFTTLDDPAGSDTDPTGVNGSTIVGDYRDSSGNSNGFVYNGSSFTNLDDPVGVNGTYITGISGGTIVGYYLDSGSIANGFVYNGSSFTTVDVPGVVNGTYISGISGSTEVGYYRNTLTRPAITVGFLYNGSSFTYPSNLTGVGLFPTGINGSTVVGDYLSGSFNPPTYGFVSNGSSFTALEEPASVKSTYVTGISGSTIVGYYPDASGLYDGFVYDGATTVAFGATAGTIVSVSTTEIVASSPAGTPGPVDVTVMTAGMTSATSPADTFAYTAAPTFTSVDTTTFAVGTAGSFSVTASGYPIPTFTQSGPLPSGVTLTSAGVLDGTPADGTGGAYTIVVTATNGISPDALQTLTLAVNQAPAITSVNTTTFTVGTAGSFPATASGYPASTFTESGPLPSGVTLTSAGVLSGTPAAGTGGAYTIVITANNGVSPDSTQTFALTVNQAPTITSANSTTFTVGTAGSFAIIASGTPASTCTESGALPAGVILSSAGVLSGTPAAGTGGAYPIVITATNGALPNATQPFILTVNQAPAIISVNSTTFTVGMAGSFSVMSSGYPAPTFNESGPLPNGVTFTAAGVFSGTPAAGMGGPYPITIATANGVLPNRTQAFTLTVNQAPAFTSVNSATFTVGAAGSFAVTASGYPTPTYTASGPLPSGVIFTSGGTVSGTPAHRGGRHLPNRHHSDQRHFAKRHAVIYADGHRGSGHHGTRPDIWAALRRYNGDDYRRCVG